MLIYLLEVVAKEPELAKDVLKALEQNIYHVVLFLKKYQNIMEQRCPDFLYRINKMIKKKLVISEHDITQTNDIDGLVKQQRRFLKFIRFNSEEEVNVPRFCIWREHYDGRSKNDLRWIVHLQTMLGSKIN